MAPTAKKLLILADDHPHVRSALERLVAGLREHATLYTAERPQDLRPLAAQRIAEADLLTIADISFNGTGGREPIASAPIEVSRDTAPLMVISVKEQGITANWMVALEGAGDGREKHVRFEEAMNQRATVLELIQSLKQASHPETAREQPAPAPSVASLMQSGLTQRQAEVLAWLADGLTNKEIARKLDVSEWTVRHHVSAILERLEVSNRGRAAQLARQLGYA